MEILRPADFCRNLIRLRRAAKQLAGLRILTFRVTRLDHKAVDDPMEEHTIVKTLAHQFQHIVAMLRGLVIKSDTNGATVCFEDNLRTVT